METVRTMPLVARHIFSNKREFKPLVLALAELCLWLLDIVKEMVQEFREIRSSQY
jgi:hypothetical protein